MVCAAVAVFHALGVAALGERHELVAKADGKGGHAVIIELRNLANDPRAVLRVARAVGEHEPVRFCGDDLCRRGKAGVYRHLAAAACQAPRDIALHAEIHQRNFGAGVAFAHHLGARDANRLHQVDLAKIPDHIHAVLHIRKIAGHHTAHGAAFPEFFNNRACIKADDAGNIKFFEHRFQRSGTAEIGRRIAQFVQKECARLQPDGFKILTADAVIADHRIRHDHALPGIGRIGQNFKVPGHGGVENDLACHLAECAAGFSLIDGTIFQNQISSHWLHRAFLIIMVTPKRAKKEAGSARLPVPAVSREGKHNAVRRGVSRSFSPSSKR